jgi:HK97 gp10 family phage protein
MAKAKADSTLRVDMYFPDMEELRAELKKLPTNLAAKHLGAALRKAVQPGLTALRKNTPKGPTGNLRKSIKTKVKTYPKQGNAVGMVGYSWGGDSKGYHQGWLEFGTKERRTKEGNRFASSFRWKLDTAGSGRGGFKIVVGKKGAAKGKMKTVSPAYPKSFFKSAKDGQRVNLGKMPVGGRTGVPPVKTAFNQAKPAMTAELRMQLGACIEKAWAELEGRTKRGLQTTYNAYKEKKILERLAGG